MVVATCSMRDAQSQKSLHAVLGSFGVSWWRTSGEMSALKAIPGSSLMTGEPCERPWCYGWHLCCSILGCSVSGHQCRSHWHYVHSAQGQNLDYSADGKGQGQECGQPCRQAPVYSSCYHSGRWYNAASSDCGGRPGEGWLSSPSSSYLLHQLTLCEECMHQAS